MSARVRTWLETALATVLGAVVIRWLQEDPRWVAFALGCLIVAHLVHRQRKAPGSLMMEGFLVVTTATIGFLTESWGTSGGHWEYAHLPPTDRVPVWVPLAWALAAVLLDRVHRESVEASAPLRAKIAWTGAAGLCFPLLGESICIAGGVWAYRWPLQLLGVPLLALLLIAYAHLTLVLIRTGLTTWVAASRADAPGAKRVRSAAEATGDVPVAVTSTAPALRAERPEAPVR